LRQIKIGNAVRSDWRGLGVWLRKRLEALAPDLNRKQRGAAKRFGGSVRPIGVSQHGPGDENQIRLIF
jgi:hypothetical protein